MLSLKSNLSSTSSSFHKEATMAGLSQDKLSQPQQMATTALSCAATSTAAATATATATAASISSTASDQTMASMPSSCGSLVDSLSSSYQSCAFPASSSADDENDSSSLFPASRISNHSNNSTNFTSTYANTRTSTNTPCNTTTSSSSTNKPLTGLMKKKPSMKSSFALTSMLAQQQDLGDNIHHYHSSSNSSDENNNGSCYKGLVPLGEGENDHNHTNHVSSSISSTTTPTTTRPTTTLAAAMADNAVSYGGVPTTTATIARPLSPEDFGRALQTVVANHGWNPEEPLNFRDSAAVRQVLELPLRHARKLRDSCRIANTMSRMNNLTNNNNSSRDGYGHAYALNYPVAAAATFSPTPLNTWVGLPYASLREERPFLYDHMHTHPLADILRQTLVVDDLSQLHQTWNPAVESAKDHQRRIFEPLLDADKRQVFHRAYESFVASCCIPLLHASALHKNVFNSSNSCSSTRRQQMLLQLPSTFPSVGSSSPPYIDPVVYRYQVFPTITVVYPNDPEACEPPTCDLNQGMSVGWLHFHVPLTASVGTSALYCERFPGREDWHALRCASVGLGYCWDGARCLRFSPLNTTGKTRVSLDFRILLVRASSTTLPTHSTLDSAAAVAASDVDDDTLCRPHHLQDAFTRMPGFYEEATMDDTAVLGAVSTRMSMHHRRHSKGQPDARCGFPFA